VFGVAPAIVQWAHNVAYIAKMPHETLKQQQQQQCRNIGLPSDIAGNMAK